MLFWGDENKHGLWTRFSQDCNERLSVGWALAEPVPQWDTEIVLSHGHSWWPHWGKEQRNWLKWANFQTDGLQPPWCHMRAMFAFWTMSNWLMQINGKNIKYKIWYSKTRIQSDWEVRENYRNRFHKLAWFCLSDLSELHSSVIIPGPDENILDLEISSTWTSLDVIVLQRV